MKKVISLLCAMTLVATITIGQIRKIPSEVTTAFEKQYPAAQEVEYKDILTSIHVHFLQDSIRMIAKYNNKGEWKETEKETSFDTAPPEIADGYQKSKYADEWRVTEASYILLPGGGVNYRIKIEKSDLQKKYLFFNDKGRLIREALTI